MKYSYAFKIHCIQLYRRGEWAEAPEGIQKRNFHKMIRLWVRLEVDMIKELKKKINSYDHVVDSHDYRIVSFGPEDKFAIVDVELPHHMDIYTAHSIVSEIEREVGDEMNLRLIIHIEPQGMTSEKYVKANKKIMDVIGRVDGFLDYHDLIITSETISFDAVIDGNVVKTSKDRTQILDRITYEMNQVIPGYKFLIRLGERY